VVDRKIFQKIVTSLAYPLQEEPPGKD